MPLRPVLLRDTTSQIAFDVPESRAGVDPSSATLTIYNSVGEPTSVVGASATVTPATPQAPARLTYSVPGSILSTTGDGWRAVWSYVVDDVAYARNQVFEVRRSRIYQTLTPDRFVRAYYPLLRDRTPRGMTVSDSIEVGWSALLDEIVALGRNPNLIIDPLPLERAHAAFTAAHIAQSLSAGSSDGGASWQQWAAQTLSDGKEMLRGVLSNVAWYDADEDLKPGLSELSEDIGRMTFSR
jgi:hypothetical protein